MSRVVPARAGTRRSNDAVGRSVVMGPAFVGTPQRVGWLSEAIPIMNSGDGFRCAQPILRRRLARRANHPFPVQPLLRKYSSWRLTRLKPISPAVLSHSEGRLATSQDAGRANARAYYHYTRGCGCSGTRHSLRPLIEEGG